MNRTIYLFLGLAVIAGVASCGKTNVRKLSGDWTVTYDELTVDRTDGNAVDKSQLILAESIATNTSEFGTAGSTTPFVETGKVAVNNFSIRKDGTWTWSKDYETSDPNYSNRIMQELSGTWSFEGKTGRNGEGFGRRERVVFHILSEKYYQGSTLIATGEVLPPEWDYTSTSEAGFRQMVYVVESSSKEELQLVSEGDKVYVSTMSSEPVQSFKKLNRLSLKQL
jgi:hypothetical protein